MQFHRSAKFLTALLLVANVGFSQQFNCTFTYGAYIETAKASFGGDSFQAIAQTDNNYYYFSKFNPQKGQLVSVNSDLTLDKIIDVTIPSSLSDGKIHSVQQIGSKHYIFFVGTTPDMAKTEFGIFAQEILLEPLQLTDAKLIAGISGSFKDTHRNLKMYVSENEQYLSFLMILDQNKKQYNFSCTTLNTDLSVKSAVKFSHDLIEGEVLVNQFLSNSGDLFLGFGHPSGKQSKIGGAIKKDFATVFVFGDAGKTDNYKIGLDQKMILGFEFVEDEDGLTNLEVHWQSTPEPEKTGILNYDFVGNKMTELFTFDPLTIRPYIRLKGSTVQDSDEEKGDCALFNMQKRYEKKYSGQTLVIYEKVARITSHGDHYGYYGDFLIYLLDEKKQIEKAIVFRRLRSGPEELQVVNMEIIHRVEDYLYLVHPYNDKTISPQSSFAITRIDLHTGEKYSNALVLAKNDALILEYVYLNSYFPEKNNSLVVAAKTVGYKYLIRITFSEQD